MTIALFLFFISYALIRHAKYLDTLHIDPLPADLALASGSFGLVIGLGFFIGALT